MQSEMALSSAKIGIGSLKVTSLVLSLNEFSFTPGSKDFSRMSTSPWTEL